MTRYIDPSSTPQLPPVDAQAELIASLKTIVAEDPPRKSYSSHDLHGIFSGPTSVALLFFHLSRSESESGAGAGIEINGKKADEWCRLYLDHDVPTGPVTPDR